MEKSYQPGRAWNAFQDQNSSVVHSGRKMSKGNIFQWKFPFCGGGGVGGGQSIISAAYFGNQNYSSIIRVQYLNIDS